MSRIFDAGFFSSALALLRGASPAKCLRKRLARGRSLRIEPCERRELLASISGTVFSDLTGDGLSADDQAALAGTTLELFRDNGDGVFSDVDALEGTKLIDPANGNYAFDALAAGRYFLRQEQPLPFDGQQTHGPDYYTIEVTESAAFAGTELVVDSFDAPNGQGAPETYFINFQDTDPTLIKTVDAGILGGERDLLVDVLGQSNALSAFGSIGFDGTSGKFDFASAAPGTQATLQYDGQSLVDDSFGPPATLINVEALDSADLTDGGVNTGLRVDFNSLQVGGNTNHLDVKVQVTDTSGGLATYTGLIAENAGPSSFFMPFTAFVQPGNFAFDDVTSVTVSFNTEGIADVDFSVDSITATALADSLDFANFAEASISGYVYVDANNDGVMDLGEKPLANTTIKLSAVDSQLLPFEQTTTTGADGMYVFRDLPPIFSIQIREEQPVAYQSGKETLGEVNGTPRGQESTNAFTINGLNNGEHGQMYNFGEGEINFSVVSKRLLVYPFSNWSLKFDGAHERGFAEAQADTPTTETPMETPTPQSAAAGPASAADAPEPISAAVPTTYEIHGSGQFAFVAGATPGDWVVKHNGVVQEIDPAVVAVSFDGLGVSDTLTLTGTDGAETLQLGPDTLTFAGAGFTVTASGVESVTADGLGGDDVAELLDSAGNDALAAWPSGAKLQGPGYEHRLAGFESLDVAATAGGYDVAKLFDSPGRDTLIGTPRRTKLSGDGYEHDVRGFDEVHGYASGGHDVAKLFDSPGSDTFIADPVQGSLSGFGYYNRAKHFEDVHAYGDSSGVDVARLYDSVGDDTFAANPTQGALYGEGFYRRAKSFEGVHAYATAGGYDTAMLDDSPGDDIFTGTPTHGTLSGDGFYNRAKFFEAVKANATAGGHDVATLVDSTAGDALQAAGDWVRLSYAAGSHRVGGFDSVRADSSQGGHDTKALAAVDFVLLADGDWTGV